MASIVLTAAAHAQTFDVDFARPSLEPPLVKTKFGVYQTPLVTLPRLLDSLPLLREIGVQDMRYEMGWGKPDVLAFDQIGGTPDNLTYDFSMVDAWVGGLHKIGVRPLLAMTYDPTPLQTRTQWARWKDMPSNLESWGEINRAYAAHLRNTDAAYEIWNEPDMPEPGGKMFFSGNASDYERLYDFAARGLKTGDGDALVGGPAVAYDTGFLTPLLQRQLPLDFASIHAYDNAPTHVGFLRGALRNRPDVPIWLTEYASFTDLPANGPQSRHAGAMRFFRDAKTMLKLTDLTRVYWAQWLDAGNTPGMGLVTFDGHRKAIFNAFKIYNMMPVDRNFVGAQNPGALDAMASSDAHRAGVVIWNTGDQTQTATVNWRGLGFETGTTQLFRVDAQHASYIDNPASETLAPLETVALAQGDGLWQGEVPAHSVVYLQLSDAATPPTAAANLGNWVRSYHWFPDRDAPTYADFDAHTATARLGMGERDLGLAQIGALVENPARQMRVQFRRAGAFRPQNAETLCGLRLDFQGRDGQFQRSVLIHNGLYSPARTGQLPWGKGGARADQTWFQPALNSGQEWTLDLDQLAPDWNGNRVIFTFLLHNTGRGSSAKWTLKRAAPQPQKSG